MKKRAQLRHMQPHRSRPAGHRRDQVLHLFLPDSALCPPGLVPEGVRVPHEPHPDPPTLCALPWAFARILVPALRFTHSAPLHRVEVALIPSGPASPSLEEGILRPSRCHILRTESGVAAATRGRGKGVSMKQRLSGRVPRNAADSRTGCAEAPAPPMRRTERGAARVEVHTRAAALRRRPSRPA